AELAQAFGAAVALAEAALLDAAEGEIAAAGRDQALVDAGGPGRDALREREAARDVGGPDAGVEAIGRLVREPHGLVGRGDPHDREHGPERLFGHDLHGMIDVREHGRLEVDAGSALAAAAAGEHGRAAGDGVRDVALDDLDLPRARERAVVDLPI